MKFEGLGSTRRGSAPQSLTVLGKYRPQGSLGPPGAGGGSPSRLRRTPRAQAVPHNSTRMLLPQIHLSCPFHRSRAGTSRDPPPRIAEDAHLHTTPKRSAAADVLVVVTARADRRSLHLGSMYKAHTCIWIPGSVPLLLVQYVQANKVDDLGGCIRPPPPTFRIQHPPRQTRSQTHLRPRTPCLLPEATEHRWKR